MIPDLFFVDPETGEKKNVFDVIDRSYAYQKKVDRGVVLNIVTHAGIQKLARYAKIRQVDVKMLVSPRGDNFLQHGVAVTIKNSKGECLMRTGEASRLNTGKWFKDDKGETQYTEKDSIDAKFRLAMAEKRAFDRAVLEELEMYDVFSAAESPDFEPTATSGITEEQKKNASATYNY